LRIELRSVIIVWLTVGARAQARRLCHQKVAPGGVGPQGLTTLKGYDIVIIVKNAQKPPPGGPVKSKGSGEKKLRKVLTAS
jgi:hypothetical protein